MTTPINPILNNKYGYTSAKALQTNRNCDINVKKMFALCLSTVNDLVMSNNHFGFKQKRSTDLCIHTVKSIIQY